MKMSLSIFFLVLAVSLNAQTPGYLGKRLYLKTSLGTMYARNITANNRGAESKTYGFDGGGFALNTQLGLQAGWAVSRRQLLSLDLSYLETGMEMYAGTPVVNNPSSSGKLDTHYLFYKLKGRSVGLGYHLFRTRKGGLAPFGAFSAFYLTGHFTKGEVQDKLTVYSFSSAPQVHGKLGFEPSYFHLSFGYEIGQNIILQDRVVLSISARLNVPLHLKRMNYVLDDGYLDDRPSLPFGSPEKNLRTFEDETFERLLKHDFFYLKIGAGYLLF